MIFLAQGLKRASRGAALASALLGVCPAASFAQAQERSLAYELEAAEAQLGAGHAAQAERGFAALRASPEVAERAAAGQARALAAQGRLEEGMRLLQSMDPGKRSAEIALARAALHLAAPTPAIDQAQIALDEAESRGLAESPWRLPLLRGELAWRLGGYQAAIGFFTTAAQHGADPAFAWRGVADSLSALGRWPEAEAYYAQALITRPNDPASLMGRARARSAQGRGDLALVDYDSAEAAGLSTAAFYRARGDLRRRMGRFEAAANDLARALKIDPEDKTARLGRATALVDLRDWEEAERELKRLEAAPDLAAEVAFQRGRVARGKGDKAGAEAFFSRVLELRPGDPSALYNRGLARLDRGRTSEAYADFAAAAARDPAAPDIRDAMGRMKLKNGQMSEALAFYNAAVAAHPKDPAAWAQRAALMLSVGQPKDALADATKALEIAPDLPQAQLYALEAHLMLKNYDAVIAKAPALARAPEQAGRAALARARAHLALAQHQEALRALDAAEAGGAPAAVVALLRGDAAFELNESDDQIGRAYNQAVSLSNGSAESLRKRARFLASRGVWAGALADAKAALERAPDDALALEILGVVLQETKDCAKAVEALDKALALDSSLTEARRARANCRVKNGELLSAMGDFLKAMF